MRAVQDRYQCSKPSLRVHVLQFGEQRIVEGSVVSGLVEILEEGCWRGEISRLISRTRRIGMTEGLKNEIDAVATVR